MGGGGGGGGGGGSFAYFHTKFREIPHENEIIWLHRGVRANPLNPSKSATTVKMSVVTKSRLHNFQKHHVCCIESMKLITVSCCPIDPKYVCSTPMCRSFNVVIRY